MRTLLAAAGLGLMIAALVAARTRAVRGTSGKVVGTVSGTAAFAAIAVPYLAE